MSKGRKVLALLIALGMAVILIGGFIAADWNTNEEPQSVPFAPEGGVLPTNSINYVLFEDWGPIMIALGAVMFGAIVAGVTLSKEEDEEEEE